MAGEAVSRDELKAMVEVQSKNVEQLTVIANHLATIVDRENKIYERLYNGLSKEISSTIVSSVDNLRELMEETKDCQSNQCAAAGTSIGAVIEDKLKNCDMAKDISYTKWFIGIVGIAIVIASVVINGIARQSAEGDTVKKVQGIFESYVQQSVDFKDHMLTHKDSSTQNQEGKNVH